MRSQEYKVFNGQTWFENVWFNWHTLHSEEEGVPVVITPLRCGSILASGIELATKSMKGIQAVSITRVKP